MKLAVILVKCVGIRTLRTGFFLAFLLYFGSHVSIAQSLKGRLPGTEHVVHSAILGENRPYWVVLPEDYVADNSRKDRYPVIYVLDGEKYLPTVAGVLDFLTSGNRLPYSECIVVGVINLNRTLDFTPTAAVSGRGGATLDNSGRGGDFARFVVNELIPEVESNWNVSDRRIIIGHSFGGLETAYILLNHREYFSDYLLFDPSLWWDDFTLLNGKLLKGLVSPHMAKNVFVGYSDLQSKSPYKQGYDFSELLKKELPERSYIRTKWYESESHGSVFVPALYDGLRMIFQHREQ